MSFAYTEERFLNAVSRTNPSLLFRQPLSLEEELHLYTLSRLENQLMGALVEGRGLRNDSA
jgi:hypothetical protein